MRIIIAQIVHDEKTCRGVIGPRVLTTSYALESGRRIRVSAAISQGWHQRLVDDRESAFELVANLLQKVVVSAPVVLQ